MIPIEYLQTKSTLWYVTGKLAFNGIKVHIIFEPLPLVDYTGDIFPTFFGGEEAGVANRLQIRGRSMTLPQDGLLEYTTQNGCSVTTHFSANTVYDIWMDKSGMTINNVRTDYPTPCSTAMGCALPINGSGVRAETAKYYFVGFYNEDDSVIEEYQPALDGDNNVCFYQKKAGTYLYHTGTGNPTGGTPLHIFTASTESIRFDATGGTSSFNVTCETGWTCTTPTAFTLSTTAGTSGDTVVTVTAANYTGSTRIDEDVVFTDDDGYTLNVHLRQKPVSTGVQSSLYIGDYNIETLMLGDLPVEAIYIGEEQVYANAPFAGLKVSPSSVALNSIRTATTFNIKSSEAWLLSTNDNWFDMSVSSGASGKSVVTVTANSAATSGDSALTGTISATTANYSATVSVSYEPTDPNIRDWCRLNGTSAGTGYIISSIDDEIEYQYAVFNGGQSSWGVFISDLLSGDYNSANIHLSRTFTNERMRVSDYGMTSELGLSTGVVYTYIASKTGATLNGSALTLSGTASLKSQGQITINGQSEGWGATYLEFRHLIIRNNGVETMHIVPYLNNGTTACLKDLVSGNIINATIADIGNDPLD